MALGNKQKIAEYSDIDLSFKMNPVTGDIAKKLDDNAIKQSILNLLSFKIFDEHFHPEINGSLHSILFENMDPSTQISAQELVLNVLSNYEPRISVTDVIVTPDYDRSALLISLKFIILNNGQETSYKFYVYNAR